MLYGLKLFPVDGHFLVFRKKIPFYRCFKEVDCYGKVRYRYVV